MMNVKLLISLHYGKIVHHINREFHHKLFIMDIKKNTIFGHSNVIMVGHHGRYQ